MKYYVGFKTGPLFEQEPKINKTYHSWKSEITLSYQLDGSRFASRLYPSSDTAVE